MSETECSLVPGCFYWVRRYGESAPTIGQLFYTSQKKTYWLIIGDEQDIYRTEIEVISGPLQEPDPKPDSQ